MQGLSTGTEHISLGDVPWYAWVRTLAFWIPLVLSLWVAVVALAVVVHKQWADHEQLPYPIARFAAALMPAEGEARGAIFRNRLFWIGAGENDQTVRDGPRLLSETLSRHGIEHVFHESEGGHTWINWRQYLCDFLQLLFRD